MASYDMDLACFVRTPGVLDALHKVLAVQIYSSLWLKREHSEGGKSLLESQSLLARL